MAAPTGTAVVAVRSGLVASLAALPEFAAVSCRYAFKAGDKAREKVFTANAAFDVEVAGLRPDFTHRNESAEFQLIVLVQGVADSIETTSTRAVELGHVVERWIGTKANWRDAALGVQLHDLTVTGRGTLAEAFAESSSISELTYPIRYTARLEV